jgi:hypothetical protein
MSLSGGAFAKLPNMETALNSLSVSFWYKNENMDVDWPFVFDFEFYSDGTVHDFLIFGRDLGDPSAVMFAGGNYQNQFTSEKLPSEWTAGTWKHYVWVLYRADSGRFSDWGIYKDGIKVAQLRGHFPSSGIFNQNHLGINFLFGTESTFQGKIDSFGIFPYALTQLQITDLYQTTSPGLVSHMSQLLSKIQAHPARKPAYFVLVIQLLCCTPGHGSY